MSALLLLLLDIKVHIEYITYNSGSYIINKREDVVFNIYELVYIIYTWISLI